MKIYSSAPDLRGGRTGPYRRVLFRCSSRAAAPGFRFQSRGHRRPNCRETAGGPSCPKVLHAQQAWPRLASGTGPAGPGQSRRRRAAGRGGRCPPTAAALAHV